MTRLLSILLIVAGFFSMGASSFYIEDATTGERIPFGTGGILRFENISGIPNAVDVFQPTFDTTAIDTHISTYETTVDNHIADLDIHRLINDALTASSTELWSGEYIKGYVDAQIGGTGSPMDITDGTTTVLSVEQITFDAADGFSVTDTGSGSATVGLNIAFPTPLPTPTPHTDPTPLPTPTPSAGGSANAWNPIQVAGQSDLTATGEQALEFKAGTGITLTSNPADTPPSLTITNSSASAGMIVFDNRDTFPGAEEYKSTLYVSGTMPPDALTRFLIHSDTTDGSTQIVDSSTVGHAITVNSVAHSTEQAVFGATSLKINNSRLQLDNVQTVGTQDFTVDFWVYVQSYSKSGHVELFTLNGPVLGAGSDTECLSIWTYNGNILYTFDAYQSGEFAFPENAWNHIAGVRAGDTFTLYLNGAAVHSVSVAGRDIGGGTAYIAYTTNSPIRTMQGYFDEIRLSIGAARWTDNFTPPVEPYGGTSAQALNFLDENGDIAPVHMGDTLDLPARVMHPAPEPDSLRLYNYAVQTATTNATTELYLHSDTYDGDPTIEDMSGNDRALTIDGTVTHTTAASVSGASSIDLSLGYIGTADFAIGTQDFTVETWARFNENSVVYGLGGYTHTGGTYWSMDVDDNFNFSGGGVVLSAAMPNTTDGFGPDLGRWYHLAVSRSGSTVYMFIDGTLVDSSSSIGTMESNLSQVGMYWPDLQTRDMQIDEYAVSVGTGRYTANFTPADTYSPAVFSTTYTPRIMWPDGTSKEIVTSP